MEFIETTLVPTFLTGGRLQQQILFLKLEGNVRIMELILSWFFLLLISLGVICIFVKAHQEIKQNDKKL